MYIHLALEKETRKIVSFKKHVEKMRFILNS